MVRDDLSSVKKQSKYLSWKDSAWSSFMVMFMHKLEPRHYNADEVVYHDMEETEEILFVQQGEYAIGYTLNSKEYLALRMGAKTVIGDYAVMFQKRSEFLYKALSPMNCMAIRKSVFQTVRDKYKHVAQKLKINSFNRYRDIVRSQVLEHKQETVL